MQARLNPLIEAAVKPLAGNAEQRLALIAVLSENADPDHPGAAEVIARWEEVDRRERPRGWTLALWVVVLVSLGFVILAQLPTIRFMEAYRDASLFELPGPVIPEGLSEKEKLLIGDPLLSAFERAEALHLSDPENPAYFAEYASAHVSEFSELPEDFIEIAARIDPGNSYFFYVAAAFGHRAVESENPPGHISKSRTVGRHRLSPLPFERDYKVKDRPAFDQSLELLSRASALPRFESYSTPMFAERIRLVESAESFIERINGFMIAFARSGGLLSIIKVADIIAARAQELSRSGDVEGFLDLVKQSDHLTQGLANNPDVGVVNEMIGQVIHSFTAQYIQYGAERLGLTDIAERYGKISDEFQVRKDERDVGFTDGSDLWLEERAAALAGTSLRQIRRHVRTPPRITMGDLAPGRYAEHDFAMHIGLSVFPFAMLILTLVVFLHRFIFPKPLRRTAARFAQLLRPSDLVIAFVFGVLLPATAILLLNRFTELGGREWSLRKFELMFPSVHLAIMLLWVLLAPAVILRWRLLRRLAPFGLKCIPGYLSLLALLAISTLAFAAYPIVLKFGLGDRPLTAIAAPLALWGTVVFFNALLGIIGKAPQRISLAATSLAVLPVYLAAIVVTPLLLPVYKASEIHWLAQDTLFNPDADAPDLGLYELRLAAQKRKETREILGLGN